MVETRAERNLGVVPSVSFIINETHKVTIAATVSAAKGGFVNC
jgi:hypothetical protein